MQRQSLRWFILILLIGLVVSACGGPPGQATPTPLPPGDPVAQSTPEFSAPLITALPTAENAAVDVVQAQLATQIASQMAAAETPMVVPTSISIEPASGLLPDALLSQPTALGIVSGVSADVLVSQGGSVQETLPAGATVTITGRAQDGAWYAVYLDSGRSGWVAAESVRVFGEISLVPVVTEPFRLGANAPADPAPTAAPDEPPAMDASAAPPATATPVAVEDTPQAVVIVDGVNVRSGPGTEFSIVGSLVRDAVMRLLGRNSFGDWVQIETPTGVGWVYAPLLELSVDVETLPIVP